MSSLLICLASPTIPLAMRIYAVAKGIFCISAYVILAMIIEFKREKISALNEMKLKMPTPTMPAEKSRKNRKKVGIRSEKISDFPELI